MTHYDAPDEVRYFGSKFWAERDLLHPDEDGLIEWFGTLSLMVANDRGNTPLDEVGHLVGYHLQLGVCGDPFWRLDGESADCCTIAETLFEEDEWSPSIVDRFGWPGNHDLLILDRIEISQKYSGHRLGLEFIKAFIETCGSSCGFVALVAQPLQHVGTDVVATDLERKAAKARLRRHYGRLGFKVVPRTDVMVLNLDYKLKDVRSTEPDI